MEREDVIVGAASMAARENVAREKQTDRDKPCPYNFLQTV